MTNIHPDADYKAFLLQGRFMIQRSTSSGRHVFYPRVISPGTGADDLQWVEACGRGSVYSTTVIRGRNQEDSYNVALIDLEEGPRMMSRVEGVEPQEVYIGMPVKSRIAGIDTDEPCVVFDPA
ncbi:hypothetical protein G8770_13925 [Aestuariicella hydrocarbonica]|uniref:ChsH2 C-terminal OB-fold domain-containing protein n=1 Tax=Pseudomaricurvus hydrocarbonicus TaxID=1470433 RepID=A0A9E5JW25_9GAMM|nr:OB-fold domain-containing protein [Aestuariicella hydrocarbonica]NHO66643.1 hypothetical protein [Aestuariicella hydrocarbonica]